MIPDVNGDDMSERKNYHHGDLRAALVEEALVRVEREGGDALSLRACARSLDVDPAAAYRHFRDKAQVLAAVSAVGFAQLSEAMREGLEGCDGATAQHARQLPRAARRFLATGEAYARFGLDHPNLYRLMFGERCEMAVISQQEELGGVTPPYDYLRQTLDEALEADLIDEACREGGELFAWSTMHGLVSLLLSGGSGIEDGEARLLAVRRACLNVLRGLGFTAS